MVEYLLDEEGVSPRIHVKVCELYQFQYLILYLPLKYLPSYMHRHTHLFFEAQNTVFPRIAVFRFK